MVFEVNSSVNSAKILCGLRNFLGLLCWMNEQYVRMLKKILKKTLLSILRSRGVWLKLLHGAFDLLWVTLFIIDPH